MGYKARTGTVGRSEIVDAARLYAVLDALSTVHYPNVSTSEWSGDTETGSYYYDPCTGDRFELSWTPTTVVGAAFDHESERSEWNLDEEDRRPLRWLGDVSDEVRKLAANVADSLERLITSVLWVDGPKSPAQLSDPIDANGRGDHGIDYFAGFLVAAEKAVFGSEMFQPWGEMLSLTDEQCRIGLRLAAQSPTEVTPAESLVLLRGEEPVTMDAAQAGAEKLSRLGISWTIPEEEIAAGLERARQQLEDRIHAAQSQEQRQFLQAAYDGDAASLTGAISAGVDLDIRTIDGQWEYTPEGDTAAITALKRNHVNLALALIEAGTPVDSVNIYNQTALHWAVRKGAIPVVERLLDAGASIAIQADTPTLHYAAREGHAAIVDRLVAAGADLSATNAAGYTAADFASFGGHAELAVRLRVRRGD